MVKVFIFGITGFIGFPTAKALRRNGHIVYGLARSTEKGKLLTQNEIIPVIGTIEDTNIWSTFLREKEVNVVLDFSGIGPGGLAILEAVKKIGEARLGSSRTHTGGPKIGYVYYSGTWVHGDHDPIVDSTNDFSPAGLDGKGFKKVNLVSWRPALEDAVLATRDVLDAVVVRPGTVFGGQGSLFSILLGGLFKSAQAGEGSVEIVGKKADLALVHKDDVAEFGLKLVEKISYIANISYPVFDLVSSHESYTRIVDAVARHIGYKGEIKYKEPANDFEVAMLTSYYTSSDRARTYLDWEPKHRSILAQIDVYADALAANLK